MFVHRAFRGNIFFSAISTSSIVKSLASIWFIGFVTFDYTAWKSSSKFDGLLDVNRFV